jgi:hypothetical protein|tara:strand:- start:742 stop:927 length:186 start_codon:yes stop_codon:yes gene_type:complete
MTWEDLRVYLNDLRFQDDSRLDNTMLIYDLESGEVYPGDTLEFLEPDDIIDETLFISINGD